MALYKSYSITLDTKRTPKVALQNIVVGETGNKLTVTLKNDGSTVSLNGTNYRVCLRVDSAKGVVRQDSSLDNSGITFDSGKAIIKLSRDSFGTGLNRCRLEIYSTETETDDTLICSSEFQFTAASNDTGENAGEVYPSLIIAEQKAAAATAAANEAAEAANSAASTLNTMLENIDSVPTSGSDHLVKSGGVYSALAGKQDTLTFDNSPTQNSNNPVKSGGVYTALAGKQDTLTFDDTPTQSSANPVKSGGVYTALSGKQDTLTFDNTPTANSSNPVTSAGILAALNDNHGSCLGEVAVMLSKPLSSSYMPGDYFIYTGEDTTRSFNGSNTRSLKKGDLIVAVQEKSGNFPAWADFDVVPGSNHLIAASSSTPAMDGTAAVGSSTAYARADHVHPSDTSKLNVASAPIVLRLEPNWVETDPPSPSQGSAHTDQFDLYGLTVSEIVAAHTSGAARPIIACVKDNLDGDGYVWVVETTFSSYNGVLYINVCGVDKDMSYVTGTLAIDISTNTFTTGTELVYYEI